MSLGYRHVAGDLELLPENPHRVRHREEDAEAILYTPLHLPADEHCHL